MSDDLCMHALSGSFEDRARGVIEAGCDLALHCSGDMAEMVSVASGLGRITEQASERLRRAMASVEREGPVAGYDELVAKRDQLLAFA